MGERIIDELDGVREELLAEKELTQLLKEQLRLADQTHQNDLRRIEAEKSMRRGKGRKMNRRVMDKIRGWVFELLPELDVRTPSSLPSTIVDALGEVKSKADELLVALRRLAGQPRIITVVLLLPDGSTQEVVDAAVPEAERKSTSFSIPCFQSWHVNVDRGPRLYNSAGDGSREIEVPVETFWKVPKGSWLVMHGATFSRAYAGAFALDRGPGGRFCRIEEEVPRGVRIVAYAKID